MLDDTQEREPGLYDKSSAIYHYKAKKIADKAASMGVKGFDAMMLQGCIKSMHTVYRKEKKSKGKSWCQYPHTSSAVVLDNFKFLRPPLKLGRARKILGKVNIFIK